MTADREASVAYADTNIFVALFAGPAHPLHERALELFRRVAAGRLKLVTTSVVVTELLYAASAVLGWSRSDTATRLSALLEADGLVVAEHAVIAQALELYGHHPRLDYPDAYLAALALVAGPPVVASFDHDLDVVEGLQRIAA